jgi:F-type H+-transporting ATPase subunit b
VLIDWFTVFAQIVNFLILVFLLKRFLYKPIVRAMEKREKRIADAMAQSAKTLKEAEQTALALKRERQSFLEAKQALLNEATIEIRKWREQALKEAHEEIERMRKTWQEDLNQEKEDFLRKLKVQVTNQVMAVGEKVLSDLADENLENKIISVFLKKMLEEKQAAGLEDVKGSLSVQSGFKLDERLAQYLNQELSSLFPDAGPFEHHVSENLGIGIMLTAGDKKIEWNLAHYLDGLEQEVFKGLTKTSLEAK